jgi:hypothetical protein
MTHKTHDLCVKTGSYEDRQTGETKGRWMNIGALMQGDDGPFIMLNACFNPAGLQREEGRDSISCFEPQQDGQREEPQRQPQRHGDRPGGAYSRR